MKPNREGRAIGLTARDGDQLRDSLANLIAIQAGLDALDGIVDGVGALCAECKSTREGVRAILDRFYAISPESDR